jgi:hypothetical protein
MGKAKANGVVSIGATAKYPVVSICPESFLMAGGYTTIREPRATPSNALPRKKLHWEPKIVSNIKAVMEAIFEITYLLRGINISSEPRIKLVIMAPKYKKLTKNPAAMDDSIPQ